MRLFRLRATDAILLIICLMYLVTYIDRVNIGTAAPALQKDLGLTNTATRPRILRLRLSLRLFPDRRRLARRSSRPAHDTHHLRHDLVGGHGPDRLRRKGRMSLSRLASCWASVRALRFRPRRGRWRTGCRPDRRGFAQGITHAFARFGNALTPPLIAALIVAYTWRGLVHRHRLHLVSWVCCGGLFPR